MESEAPKRLGPTKDTLIRLFGNSGNHCAFPGCPALILNEAGVLIGQVCHIEAALPGGERFNPNQSNYERRSYDNLLLLCYPHHIESNDVDKYPVEILRKIKSDHEQRVKKFFTIEETTLNEIYKNQKPIQEDQFNLVDTVRRIETKLDKQLNLFSGPTSTDSHSIFDQDQTQRDIQDAIDQRKKGNPNKAIALLALIKDKKWQSLNEHNKYLLFAETGIAQLDLDQDLDAALNFIKALDYNSDNPKALGLAAIGYLLLGQKDDAKQKIEDSIKLDPNSTNAYLALIQISIEDHTPFEIIDRLPKDQLEVPEIEAAIAEAYNSISDNENATIWFEKALKHNPINLHQTKVSLAYSIINSCKDEIRTISGSFNENLLGKVNYAITLLTEAWDSVKNTELGLSKVNWLFNRGIAYRSINELEESYSDIKNAISIDNTKPEFHIQFAIASFLLRKLDQSMEIANAIERDFQSIVGFRLNLFKASICFKQEKYEESVRFAKLELGQDINISDRNISIGLVIDSYLSLRLVETAKDFILGLIDISEKDARLFLEGAKVFLQSGDIQKGNELLSSAVSSVSDITSTIDVFELANTLIKNDRDNEAIPLLERIVDDDVYSPISINLLQVLYKKGEYRRALTICEKLGQRYGPIDIISEIQSSIYESIDNPEKAIGVCEVHLATFPDDQIILLRLIVLQDKYHKEDLALRNILQLKISNEWDNQVLLRIAFLFTKYNMDLEGMELAYSVRRNKYNVSDVHQAYVSLITSQLTKDFKFINHDSVKVNTTVIYKDSTGALYTYTIVDFTDGTVTNELTINDKLAKHLMGRAVGDRIVINRDPGNDLELQITGIHDKYLYAWNESVNLLRTRFFEGHSFISITVGNSGDRMKDFKPMFDLLDQQLNNEESLNNLYKQNKLTVGALAILKQTNPCKIWAGLVNDPNLGVFCTGQIRNTMQPNVVLDDTKPIVIDITCLMSFASLNNLDSLIRQPRRILVSQSSLFTLQQMIDELAKAENTGIKIIRKVKSEGYIPHEIARESVVKMVSWYKNLTQWIHDNSEVLPCNMGLEMNFHEKEEFDQVLGRPFFDSILLAKEFDGILLSDDEFLRLLACTKFEVSCISIFDWLAYHQSLSLIDVNVFNNSIIELIKMGYKYLPVNDNILFECAKVSGFSFKHPFSLALKTLNGRISGLSAIDYSVKFLKRLYSEPQVSIFRIDITMMVLNELFMDRDLEKTHVYFCHLVTNRFHLLQLQKDQVLDLERTFYYLRKQ